MFQGIIMSCWKHIIIQSFGFSPFKEEMLVWNDRALVQPILLSNNAFLPFLFVFYFLAFYDENKSELEEEKSIPQFFPT